jgi:hypothetical protein
MSARLTVSLTGGLGNQLFQYAALLHLGEGRKLGLTQDFGRPRVQKNGKAELFSFNLECEEIRYQRSFLGEKFAGYLLRLGVHRKFWEIRPLMRFLATSIGSIYLSLSNRRPIIIKGYSALGHSSHFSLGRFTNLVVGYFQNAKWVSEDRTRANLMKLSLKEKKKEFEDLVIEAKNQSPLVVHVRLGDYKEEEDFGILPDRYYEVAIEEAWNSNRFEKIWLFSDEPREALAMIPTKFRTYVRIISFSFSPAESLELMRYGQGYVIANSTFSWWGAMLSYNENARVFAPEKWFKSLKDPEHLIPDHWRRVRSW